MYLTNYSCGDIIIFVIRDLIRNRDIIMDKTACVIGDNKDKFPKDKIEICSKNLEKLINDEKVTTFYFADITELFAISLVSLIKLKKEYTHIKIIFVVDAEPEDMKVSTYKDLISIFDDVLFMPLHNKAILVTLNEKVIEMSDVVIIDKTKETPDYDLINRFISFAKEKNKIIKNIFEDNE